MKKFPITNVLKKFSKVFNEAGYKVYIVGGAVRDYMLGIDNHDYDFATDATPQTVIKLFKRVIPTGIKHGTVTVIFRDEKGIDQFYEVTTFRTDGNYNDSRHPENVQFIGNLVEDLERRDFTINALAASLQTGEVLDYHNGEKDLENKVIRCINEPQKRLTEDALRMLRACRFASKLNFTIEPKTYEAIKLLHNNILNVSKERIKDEVDRMLLSDNPIIGINLMKETGLFSLILPEFSTSLYFRNISYLENARKLSAPLPVCFATLLIQNDNDPTFARKTLLSLKAANKEIKIVTHLIKLSSLDFSKKLEAPMLRRYLNQIDEDLENYILFKESIDKNFDKKALKHQIENTPYSIIKIKDLEINGEDLHIMGYKAGPIYKEILDFVFDKVIENPNLNKKETLKDLIRSNFS